MMDCTLEQSPDGSMWHCVNQGCEHRDTPVRRHHTAPPRRNCTSVAPKESRGLGDTVAKAIHTVTGGLVKPCGGCKKRQEALNNLLPYRDHDPDDGRNG